MTPREFATSTLAGLAAASCLAIATAVAAPPVDVAKLEAMALRRFPQPVLVSDLAGIPVLDDRLGRLGTTGEVVRGKDGATTIVIRYGGVLGFGARRIALPLAGVAMLGRQVVVMDITAEQLDAWPTWTGADAQPLPGTDVVKVGLTKN